MQMWKQLRRSLLTVSDSGKIAESSVQRKINKPAHVGMAVTRSVSQARCVYEKCITYQQEVYHLPTRSVSLRS